MREKNDEPSVSAGSSQAAELELASWRRLTAEMYAKVRALSETDPARAHREYCIARDAMFRSHSQSPLGEEARRRFRGLSYFPYDPAWRLVSPIAPIPAKVLEITLPEGLIRCRTFATVAVRGSLLTMYWIEGYGGGLFLPFKDLTSGSATYGGGRYLYDTIKGADLGAGPATIVLDFNFSYNPSCAYSPRWVCPLAPRENALSFAVEAGERMEGTINGGLS